MGNMHTLFPLTQLNRVRKSLPIPVSTCLLIKDVDFRFKWKDIQKDVSVEPQMKFQKNAK